MTTISKPEKIYWISVVVFFTAIGAMSGFGALSPAYGISVGVMGYGLFLLIQEFKKRWGKK